MVKKMRSAVFDLAAIGLASLYLAGPAMADGEFAQVDVSSETVGIVLSVGRGNWTTDLSYFEYNEGWAKALSLRHPLPIAGPLTLKLGPTVSVRYENATGRISEDVGVRFSAERYQPTDFGSLYVLGELGSVDNASFALAQVGFKSGFAIEMSAGGSDSYSEKTIGFSQRINGGPYSVRAGYRFETKAAFLGFSFNTF